MNVIREQYHRWLASIIYENKLWKLLTRLAASETLIYGTNHLLSQEYVSNKVTEDVGHIMSYKEWLHSRMIRRVNLKDVEGTDYGTESLMKMLVDPDMPVKFKTDIILIKETYNHLLAESKK